MHYKKRASWTFMPSLQWYLLYNKAKTPNLQQMERMIIHLFIIFGLHTRHPLSYFLKRHIDRLVRHFPPPETTSGSK